MYEAVRNGDYTSLNNALDKKNADINMTWVIYDLICTAYNAPPVGIEIRNRSSAAVSEWKIVV